jgi:protocatechuate 3,4-dioxygenase beta subunit
LPDFNEPGPKLIVSGVVYQRDGRTPAKDVVIYFYHTDQSGRYTPGAHATGWEKRNGRIRGWVKTGFDGRYTIYTLKPAPYPNTNIAAHIHALVKEPDKNEYYIDEFLFDDDPKLTEKERKMQYRGGYGIMKLSKSKDGVLHGTRNIVLGLNVPDYY